MLDLLLGATQNHHPGIFPSLQRALRNQFPRQNVIIIAQSRAHRFSNLTLNEPNDVQRSARCGAIRWSAFTYSADHRGRQRDERIVLWQGLGSFYRPREVLSRTVSPS